MRFESKASSYHEIADIQKVVADWCSEWIEKDCEELQALELGSGTGLFTRHLALRNFKRLVASDIASSMIEEGRKRLPFIEWKILDAWRLSFERVDRLYACSLLQWAVDPLDILKQWRELLSPGGSVLVALFLKGSLEEFASVEPNFSAIRWFDESEWHDFFDQAGFEVARSDCRNDVITFDSSRQALRSLHDIGAVEEHRMKTTELRQFLKRCDEGSPSSFQVTWKAMRLECFAR